MTGHVKDKRVDPGTAAGLPVAVGAKLRQGALFLGVIWLLLAAFPPVPPPTRPGLDPGWVLGLNLAHVQGLAHGKDIVWSYGPLSYLALPVAGLSKMYLALIFRLGTYSIWCAALLRMAWSAATPWKYWVVPFIALCVLLDPLTDCLPSAIFAWSLLILVDRSWRAAGLVIFAFLAALECMIKVNLGVEAICLFGAVAIGIVLQEAPLSRQSKWQIIVAAFLLPVFAVLLYAAETGTAASLPAYIRSSVEIVSGYSEAMSMNGPYWQVLLAIIGMAVLFVGMPLMEGSIRTLAAAFLPTLVYVFFRFKAGIVRQDAHASDIELNLALAAVFLLVFVRRKRTFYFAACFQAVCLFISHSYISEAWPTMDPAVVSRLKLQGSMPALRAFLQWPKTWASLEKYGRQDLLPLRVSPELQAVIGNSPVEVVPWDVNRVKANDWTWRPRPVFQAYEAYTSWLDHINAEYLESGRAAEFALVNWSNVDDRHQFLDTPLSWRTQLNLYQTRSVEADSVLLQRRAVSRWQAVEPMGFETTTWDRENRVPQSPDPVMLTAHVPASFSGKLRSLLFRSNPLFIEVTRQSGEVTRYRALRSTLANGVIMNQLPEKLGDIALLADSGCALSDPVVSFRFQTASPEEFDSNIRLEWARVVRRPEPPGHCIEIMEPAAKAPVWGGVVSVPVSAGAGTSWGVTTHEPWVSVSQGGPRVGDGVAEYAVLRNSGAGPREGVVEIGGRLSKILQAGRGGNLANRASVQLGYYGEIPSMDAVRPELALNLDLIISEFENFAAPVEGQPVLGDWTGSGRMRIGIFRDGHWYLDLNGNGRWDGKEGGDGVFLFGLPGDIAVPGDWAGDGKTRLAVFRHGEWAFDMNGNMAFDRSDKFVHYGLEGDIPVVAKWSHDRMDRVGVFRKGKWLVDSNGDGVFERTDETFEFGLADDVPLVSFGNGRIGIYRNGVCILATNDQKQFDAKTVIKIPCGSNYPLIAAW